MPPHGHIQRRYRRANGELIWLTGRYQWVAVAPAYRTPEYPDHTNSLPASDFDLAYAINQGGDRRPEIVAEFLRRVALGPSKKLWWSDALDALQREGLAPAD